MNDIISWYNNLKIKNTSSLQKSEEYKELLLLTSFLDEYYKIIPPKQRIWHITNNNFEIQKCVICGNVVNFDISKKKYNYTCSKICFKQYRDIGDWKDKFKQTCLNKFAYIFAYIHLFVGNIQQYNQT